MINSCCIQGDTSSTADGVSPDLKTKLVIGVIASLFDNEEKTETKEEEPDLFEQMENFLNNPYPQEEEKEEEETQSFLSAIIGTCIALGVLYLIGKNKEE